MIEASVLVVGAGAIGGVTAAKMTGEVDVAVLDADEEHVERMRGDGLRRPRRGAQGEAGSPRGPHSSTAPSTSPSSPQSAAPGERSGTAARPRAGGYLRLSGQRPRAGARGRYSGGERLIWGTVEWGATNLGPGRLADHAWPLHNR